MLQRNGVNISYSLSIENKIQDRRPQAIVTSSTQSFGMTLMVIICKL